LILTPDYKQYVYKLCDFSSYSHTGEFLAEQINNILIEVGPEKFASIVSDNAGNVRVAREIIARRYPNILNLRCIAHCFNLISKDILRHPFSESLLRRSNKIIKFFRKSHQPNSILESYIKDLKIKGGGLKSYSKTRWCSMYDSAMSIVRLQPVFQLVKIYLYKQI
jgi:hypothetical protein